MCVYIYNVYTSIYLSILSYCIYQSIYLSLYQSGQATVAKAPPKAVIAKAPVLFFRQVPTSPNLELVYDNYY